MIVLQANKAYAPTIGGVETVVQTLAEGLSRVDGITVEVLACTERPALRSTARTVGGITVTYAANLGTIASMPISPAYAWRLSRTRADIIHVHAPFPLTDFSLSLSPWRRRRKPVVVVTWHSDIVRQKRALALYRPLLLSFLRSVDAIVVATPLHISSSSILPAFREKCHIIPFGLDLDWAKHSAGYRDAVAAQRADHAEPLILFVGRLVYYKGVEYLVEAMRRVPVGRLVIVGQGPIEAEVRERLQEYGLQERVTLLPPLPAEELRAWYHACDLLVLPSIQMSEAFGLVLLEAMACGKPVISTDLGTGISHVNKHGVTGVVVPPRDAGALASAINTLVTSPARRAELGGNGRRRAFEEFTQEAMVRRTAHLYRELLARRGENG
jgi:rhamnosyl/mannosyltransferase